jgi:hypothetical protein
VRDWCTSRTRGNQLGTGQIFKVPFERPHPDTFPRDGHLLISFFSIPTCHCLDLLIALLTHSDE